MSTDFLNRTSEDVVSTGLDDLVSAAKASEECVQRLRANLSLSELCRLELASDGGANRTNSTAVAAEADSDESLNYTKLIVLSVIIVLTIIGNICVIIAIICRRIKMTRMYYFILHLSLADLLTAFFTLLPELIWTTTYPYFYGGNSVCKAVKFLQMLGPYLSSYVLIMTALDRFQAICHPLSNCTWTPKRSNIMIFVAWVISILLCIPQAVIFHGTNDNACAAHFPPHWGVKAYVTWFAVSNFFIPLVVLIYCYGRICHAIWDNFNSKTTSRDDAATAAAAGGQDQANDADAKQQRASIWTRCCPRPRREEKVKLRWQSKKRLPASSTEGTSSDHETAHDVQHTRIVIESPSHHSTNGGVATTVLNPDEQQTTSFALSPRRGRSRRSGRLRRGSSASGESSPSPPQMSGRSSPQRKMNPRSHSIRGISRAKIKTIKLTVVVIVGYVLCSVPFICVQFYATFGSPPQVVMNSLIWLFWLLTLNSVVNPWIYMMFNANLVESLYRVCCPFQTACPCPCTGKANNYKYQATYQSRNNGQTQISTTCTGIVTLAGNGSTERLQRSRSNTGGSSASAAIFAGSNTLPPMI